MIQEPPVPPPETPLASVQAEPAAASPFAPNAEGTVVIDLTRLAPPSPAEECAEADPFQGEIMVCTATPNPPRLGPMVGPVDDGFGSAIPRARIKLSENAEAQANLTNSPVGGFNANGGEVRLKIGF